MNHDRRRAARHSHAPSIDIFAGLDVRQRQAVSARMTRRAFANDAVIFQEGDAGGELYLVQSGSVRISVRTADNEELTLSSISAGNFFGEMSIIEQAPRSATCRATQDSVLLALKADDFLGLIGDQPDIAVSILQRMLATTTARLLNTGAFLSQMVQWGEAARKRAVTDEATGLFNRRFLDDSLDGLFHTAQAAAEPFSLGMFDLDHFGDLNRKYGQPFGDHVIVEASKVFRRVFLPTDVLVRYGGDEFTFVFPQSRGDEALARCRALCEALRELRFDEHPEVRLTASLGVAEFPSDAADLQPLREAADRALYRAKESGRDRAMR